MTTIDRSPRPHRTLLVALLTLAVLDGTVRLVSHRLATPGAWPTTEYERHERQMARLESPLDTLVVGSSIAGVAIRPDDLLDPGDGYNHWLAGPAMASIADLTRNVLLDRSRPGRLVVGVTMREFNDGPSQVAHHEAMLASFGYRDEAGTATVVDRADEVLRSASAIAANRELLRDPVRFVDRLRSEPLVPERIDADGHLADRGDRVLADESPDHLRQERDAMASYTFSESGLEALDRLLVECRERNIGVLVVNLPVTDTFIGFATAGVDDQERFEVRVRAATEARGGTWVDALAEPWPDDVFADVSHLNDRGASRLGRLLEPALRLVPVGSPSRSADSVPGRGR